MQKITEGLSTEAAELEAEDEGKPQDFFSFTKNSLAEYLQEKISAPKFLAEQLFSWVYKKHCFDFSKMSNISQKNRDVLPSILTFKLVNYSDRQISSDGTRKYLFEVAGGVKVESVMIKQPKRMTLCISSQYGCGMACAFCRTGTMGFQGNLSIGDIVRQVMGVILDAKKFDDAFSNIVFMGMGEPLHNFNGVTGAIKVLTDDSGLAIAPRRITVSTVGLVPAIKKFFDQGLNVNLAVSLNATTDEVRNKIMPINKRFPIATLLETLSSIPLGKRKKITIEYVLLAGINDSKEDMARLIKLLRGMPVKVNLIPYNNNAGLGFNTPKEDWVYEWQNFLNYRGLDSTIRWSKGKDINAACGQLVTEKLKKKGLEVVS